MHSLPLIFARQLNPGVVLTQELSMKIFKYETLKRERSQLDDEIVQIRKKQDNIEDNLAEALAEDEFQRCQQGELLGEPNEQELLEIFKQHLGRIIDKLATKYERKIYLEMDLQKMKTTIEKEIVAVNEETAAANKEST
ncbi:uncharacterized protein LOC117564200 [Drosophila albomicans]|uniref:Uncharacterized protein LOC117564200 n=1 Tax=Drosophila albomicans TaxID=7291 RepID=A0A6P8W5Q5_DROAB|nr:uncharacterized protein LOC117564200 [Drosophila albomicans]